MTSRRPLAAAAALATLAALGCNNNTVAFQSSSGAVVESRPVATQEQVPMDILWVIDNSFSMCEEQQLLRDNFKNFINTLEDTRLDFHLAVTTTHDPFVKFDTEPLAVASVIQALPQPVPASSPTCLLTSDARKAAGATSEYEPVRQALALAKTCLADPSLASNYEWTDPQIACAYAGPNDPLRVDEDCVAATGIPDTDANGVADEFDLFPTDNLYRSLRGGGKVIKAQEYRNAAGDLDIDALSTDFGCMATAGTLGTGYEKGLSAAARAVSPEFTGLATGIDGGDTLAPNHGFLRRDAQFALIFVTDENDCSHNGEIQEQGDRCGGDSCYYWNSTQISAADSPLIPVENLAEEFRINLAASKGFDSTTAEGLEALEEQILVSSIHGGYNRYNQPYPSVCDGTETKPGEDVHPGERAGRLG